MKLVLLLTSLLALASCVNNAGDSTQTTNNDPQPGQIQLVQGLTSASSFQTTDSSSTYVFNLDTAKSSIETEFILQNTGDYDVKNIKLTTNNPHFYFSPSEIPILPSSKKSLIIQVIKLKVIHGVRLDGIGTDSLLPMGNNIANAQITATTSNFHHDSINISQNAQLKVFAKVMDISAFHDSTPINLFQAGTISGTPFPYGTVYSYNAPGSYKIVNTGNVNIVIRRWNDGQTAVLDSALIKPGESYSHSVPKGNNSLPTVELDAKGVVGDSFKFHRNSDGRIFILFAWF